jgi:Carboxylesterase family
MEETLFGISQQEIPQQDLKQDEFECLNLNITCPSGMTPLSCLPVMLWIHGLVVCPPTIHLYSYFNSLFSVGAIKVQVPDGFMTAESSFAGV